MVAVRRSNPTGGNFLVNLFFRNFFLSVSFSVRYTYREKSDSIWCFNVIATWPIRCRFCTGDTYWTDIKWYHKQFTDFFKKSVSWVVRRFAQKGKILCCVCKINFIVTSQAWLKAIETLSFCVFSIRLCWLDRGSNTGILSSLTSLTLISK